MTRSASAPSAEPESRRFAQAAAGFADCRVVVLGDVMLDRYIEGSTDRVSPEAPVPVVRMENEWEVVGGAGNVAANIRGLGARCDLVGVLGDDAAGRAVDEALARIGVGRGFVLDPDRPTTVKTRVLARGQQVVRVDREHADDHGGALAEMLVARLDERLPGAHALVMADYDKGVLSPVVVRNALAVAAAQGVPTIVDPKLRRFFSYAGATVFKPNRREIGRAIGEPARPGDAEWMEGARRRIGCRHLLLTLGAGGMALASENGRLDRVRVTPRSVYDVSGAGDTVSAVVAVAAAAGAAIGDAVRWSAHGAAVGLATAGAATVTADEIRMSLETESA